MCGLFSAASGPFTMVFTVRSSTVDRIRSVRTDRVRMKLSADQHLKCLFKERESTSGTIRRSTKESAFVQSYLSKYFQMEKSTERARTAPILYLQNDFWVVNCLERSFLFSNGAFNLHRSMFAEKSQREFCRLHRCEHIAVHRVATSEESA